MSSTCYVNKVNIIKVLMEEKHMAVSQENWTKYLKIIEYLLSVF